MEPLRLVLENFMGHRATDIDCTVFSSVLIVGKSKNDDRISNGAGKSTIFKAIEYVLFGEYETKSVDKLVRNGCERAKVVFDFSLGTETFRVQRTRNRKSGKSDLRMWEKHGEVWKDISQKTSTEMELELAKLIKISHQAFKNSVLFAQSDVEGLSSTKSPDKRKLILKEALNLAVYGKFEKLAKEKISEISKKIIAHRAIINSLGKPSEEITTMSSKLQDFKTLLSEREIERQEILVTLTKKQSNLLDLQKVINSETVEIQHKLTEIQLAKNQLQNNVNNSKRMLAEKESLLQSLRTKAQNKIDSLKQLDIEHNELKNKTVRQQDIIKKDLEFVSTNEYNGKLYIISLENKLRELQRPFPDGSQCPQCRQPVGHEHKMACLTQISVDIQATSTEITQKKKILESVKSKKNRLEYELTEANNYATHLSALEYKIENKKSEIQRDADYVKQIDDLIIYLKTENDNHVNNLNVLTQKEQELKKIIKDIDIEITNDKINKSKFEIGELEKRTKYLSEYVSNINTQIGIFTEKIDGKEKDYKRLLDLEAKLKILEKEYQIKQIVVQGFGSGGIPTIIIYTILDDLQVEANKLLAELRPGLELQFSVTKNKADGQQEDTLDISYRLHGTELDGEQLSGGQRLLIALSLRIGLSLVIQHRLGVDIKFLELDEVDEKLDKAGVEAFANMIKKLQDKFKIFVITHNDALKNKFSHAILVEYDENNGSTSKVVDSW